MSKLDTYISENKDEVKKWVISLASRYVIQILESKEEPTLICSTYVCGDQRRTSKCIEVLKYLGIVTDSSKEYLSLYGKWEQTYSLTIDPSKIEEVAGAYTKPHDFETKAPDKIMDRTYSYPTPDSMSKTGLIHYYLHPDEYNVYDRMEDTKRSRYLRGRLMVPEKIEQKHVIRLYPKNLEVDAEKAVFWKKATDYFEDNMDDAINMVYGFMPEALSSKSSVTHSGTGEIKRYTPERVNKVRIDTVTKESVSKKLIEARHLLAYAEATIRDLEKLEDLVPNTSDKFKKVLYEKAEDYLTTNAPLLINSNDKTAQEVAELILKGSNKGIL